MSSTGEVKWRGMCSPLILSITTRGIGINLCSFYTDAGRYLYSTDSSSDDDYEVELPNIYATYRALLALVESRFVNVIKKTTSHYYEHMYNYSPIPILRLSVVNIPIIFKRLLEAIDVIQYKDITYFPAMSRNSFSKDGNFIPRPENIILSNLRQTVVALQALDVHDDDDSALQHRKSFYENNPIPGAIWNKNNFKLLNADEIIPPDYDLYNHVEKDKYELMKLPWKLRGGHFSKYINKDDANRNITRKRFSSFICNKMGDLRVPDRESGQKLDVYQRSCGPRGRIEPYSRFKLRKEHIIKEGALFLLGEYPNNENFARPIYELRSEHVNPYFYHSDIRYCLYSNYTNDISLRNA